jgi:hypothetical protein
MAILSIKTVKLRERTVHKCRGIRGRTRSARIHVDDISRILTSALPQSTGRVGDGLWFATMFRLSGGRNHQRAALLQGRGRVNTSRRQSSFPDFPNKSQEPRRPGNPGFVRECLLTVITGRSRIKGCDLLAVVVIALFKVQSAGVRAILPRFLGKPVECFQRMPPKMGPNPLPQDVLLFPRQGVFEAYAVSLQNPSSIASHWRN